MNQKEEKEFTAKGAKKKNRKKGFDEGAKLPFLKPTSWEKSEKNDPRRHTKMHEGREEQKEGYFALLS